MSGKREGRAVVKARFGIAMASAAVVAGGLLTAGIVAATTAGASTVCSPGTDCYQVTGTPATVAAGASQVFTITVTNESSGDTLGSVLLSAPSGFVVSGASGGTASYTAGSALFLNLGLSNGQPATLTVDATAPCSGAGSAWTVQPGESSQFTGTNGDDDGDAAADFQVASVPVTVTGTCSLAFQDEPNGTVAGSPITSQVGSAGSAVSVEVLDGSNQLITSSTAPVTVQIGANPNPGSGTLSGTTTVNAIGGVASFPGLSINQTGSGYTLDATSPGIPTMATSAYFDIWGVLQGCSVSQCTGSSSTTTTTGTVTTSSASSGQFLGVGLRGVSFTCGGSYQPESDPLSFDVLSPSGAADSSAVFNVTLKLSKNAVQSSGHPGASTWQICFGSDIPFTARPGTSGTATIGNVTYYTGLLPDCSSTQPAPCVQSRNKTNAGVEVVTFLGTGDAYGKM